MTKTGYIYCIKNTVNDKVYVGKTNISVEARFKMHLKEYSKDRVEKRPLYAAMKKYGADKFYPELIETVNGDINEREAYWIAKLNTYHNGYNATMGGDGSALYDAEAFVDDFNDGMLVYEIAAKYGCDDGTVAMHLTAAGIDTRANDTARKSVAVHQYTKDGKYLRTHKSISAAARYVIEEDDLDRPEKGVANNIRESANGKRKNACGYSWKYAS